MNEIWQNYESAMLARMTNECAKIQDPSHDILHVKRVVELAKKIAKSEGADLNIVVPASYLHDLVLIPKNDPRRKEASKLSAEEAIRFLRELFYPEEFLEGIYHAILGHSYSANVSVSSIEAKVVQDADRLDGIGAIGIARAFTVGAMFGRSLYDGTEPFAHHRELNDSENTLDHFYIKILNVFGKLQTETGRDIGRERQKLMEDFIDQLKTELR